MCVWELSSGKLLYEFNGSSAAISLAWFPSREDEILCGMLDGYVVSLSFSVVGQPPAVHSVMRLNNIAQAAISARGFIVHSTAVECLVIRGHRVASGADREVRIWDWTADGERPRHVTTLQASR